MLLKNFSKLDRLAPPPCMAGQIHWTPPCMVAGHTLPRQLCMAPVDDVWCPLPPGPRRGSWRGRGTPPRVMAGHTRPAKTAAPPSLSLSSPPTRTSPDPHHAAAAPRRHVPGPDRASPDRPGPFPGRARPRRAAPPRPRPRPAPAAPAPSPAAPAPSPAAPRPGLAGPVPGRAVPRSRQPPAPSRYFF